jgi:hypothetical protein
MPDVLTDQTDVKCIHQATAKVVSKDTKVSAQNGHVLVASDVHQVVGCPFMKGTTPSPCVTIQWSNEAQKVKVNGEGVLTNQSIGQCIAADQSKQGIAIISNSKKAKAL